MNETVIAEKRLLPVTETMYKEFEKNHTGIPEWEDLTEDRLIEVYIQLFQEYEQLKARVNDFVEGLDE